MWLCNEAWWFFRTKNGGFSKNIWVSCHPNATFVNIDSPEKLRILDESNFKIQRHLRILLIYN